MLMFMLLLLCLAVVALLFVLWPFVSSVRSQGEEVARSDVNVDLYKEHLAELDAALEQGRIEQDQYKQLVAELELALLADEVDPSVIARRPAVKAGRLGALVLAPVFVVLSLSWYWHLGASQEVEITQLVAEKYLAEVRRAQGVPAVVGEAELPQVLIEKLERQLQSDPENTQYWYLLARVEMEQGRYADAVAAYQQILQRESENIQIIAELAQAQFLAAGNRIDPLIDSLVGRVLAADANNPTALGLAGISAFERKDYPAAVRHWLQAVEVMGPASPGAAALMAGIAKAEQLSAGVAAESAEAAVVDAAGGDVESVSVYVSLAAQVDFDPDSTVFVYARAWQGSKMPLAIVKLSAADLPRQVVLDKSVAMAAGVDITSAEALQLVARVSVSGSAVAQSGDWQGELGPLTLSQLPDNLQLQVGRQLP